MNCDGKCKGRMRDCCSDGEGAGSSVEGSRKERGEGAKMHSHEIGHRMNAAKPEWVQAVAIGIILMFLLGIALRGM